MPHCTQRPAHGDAVTLRRLVKCATSNDVSLFSPWGLVTAPSSDGRTRYCARKGSHVMRGTAQYFAFARSWLSLQCRVTHVTASLGNRSPRRLTRADWKTVRCIGAAVCRAGVDAASDRAHAGGNRAGARAVSISLQGATGARQRSDGQSRAVGAIRSPEPLSQPVQGCPTVRMLKLSGSIVGRPLA